MIFNLPIIAAAALIPLLVGFIWYNPKTLGTAWMRSAGLTEESMKGANMLLIFGLTYVLSFLFAAAITGMVMHLNHVFSLVMDEPGFKDPTSEVAIFLKGAVENYGDNYRTFKHGAFHGFFMGLTISLPILGINALFERKGFKYIAINVGFWTICFTLMAGVICAFS